MKRITLLAVAAFTFATFASAFAGGEGWITDMEAAKAQASKEKKDLLLDFTGSDWCGWCIKMKKETLDSKEFAAYAAKNLVLLEVDFPNAKPQSAELKAQNAALKTQYAIEGFPTFVLIDKEGKQLGKEVGYVQGGPAGFIAKLEGFKKP